MTIRYALKMFRPHNKTQNIHQLNSLLLYEVFQVKFVVNITKKITSRNKARIGLSER